MEFEKNKQKQNNTKKKKKKKNQQQQQLLSKRFKKPKSDQNVSYTVLYIHKHWYHFNIMKLLQRVQTSKYNGSEKSQQQAVHFLVIFV